MDYCNFLDLTPRQFINALKGYYESINNLEQAEWERTRWLGSIVVNKPVMGVRSQGISPRRLLPFPWDGKSSLDEAKEIQEYIREENRQNGN